MREQRLVQWTVRSEQFVSRVETDVWLVLSAVCRRYGRPCRASDDQPRVDIPGIGIVLPDGVRAAGCEITEVQCSRAEPTNARASW